jgi:hypothetical protein
MVDALPVKLEGLTPIQAQLLRDKTHRFFVVPSGRRSRKTLIGSRKVLTSALRNPRHRYFHGAPTRSQAKAIFWDRVKSQTRPFWIKEPSETDLCVTLLNGTEIHVVGLDKPQRIEGQPWHGCHITELADTKPGGWEANIRPVLSDTGGWAYLDGVPEGRNHWYDLALYACGGAIPKSLPGEGSYLECPEDPEWAYYHWFSSDVLAPKEIEAAKRSMDERIFRQEYEGSFEGFDGLAYHAFGAWNLTEPRQADPMRPIIIAMDFNFDPMCSVAIQEEYVGGRLVPVVIESFAFRNCDTDAACERILNHFGKDFHYEVFPDPAANSRTAHGAGKTDITLIRKGFAGARGLSIKVKPSHPKRKDRLNAVNARLRNAAGEVGLLIGKNCKPLIHDLQRATMEEFLNGNFSDPDIGHISDGLGYYIDYRFPVVSGGGRYVSGGYSV